MFSKLIIKGEGGVNKASSIYFFIGFQQFTRRSFNQEDGSSPEKSGVQARRNYRKADDDSGNESSSSSGDSSDGGRSPPPPPDGKMMLSCVSKK